MFHKLIVAFAVLLLGVTSAAAQSCPEFIQKRQTLMKKSGEAAKIGTAMIKGETPFNAAKVQEIYAAFADDAKQMPTLFPDCSKNGGCKSGIRGLRFEDGVCAKGAARRPRNVYHVSIAGGDQVSRLRTFLFVTAACIIFGLAAIWILTLPSIVPAATLPAHTPNLANGETMFNIGGCSSCHAVPNNSPEKVDRKRLGGGLALKSPFGVFYAPNISPDSKDGIGSWSEANFVSALWKGTSEHGANLYPAFPYTSYRYMELDDVRDLFHSTSGACSACGKCCFSARGPSLPIHPSRRNIIAAPTS